MTLSSKDGLRTPAKHEQARFAHRLRWGLAPDLEELGLAGLFASVVNSSRIGAAKPSYEPFAAALAAAGVPAEEAIFVDDSAANVLAAAGLGVENHRYMNCPELKTVLQANGLVRRGAE